MDRLPKEIISLILGKLDDESLESSYIVSKSWKALIDKSIGLIRNIGPTSNFIPYYARGKEFLEVDRLSEIGIKSCVLSDIESQKIHGCFLSWYLLKEMTICGGVSLHNFNKLMNPLKHLSVLRLHLTVLNKFAIQEPKALLDFPVLKEFALFSEGLEDVQTYQAVSNPTLLCSNIMDILVKSKFNNLKTALFFGLPIVATNKGVMLEAVVLFIYNHQLSLREFCLVANMELRARLPLRHSTEIQRKLPKEFPNLKLETVEMILKSFNNQNEDNILEPIIRTQTSLQQYVNFGLPSSTQFSGSLIRQNLKQLTIIELNVISRNNTLLDFEAFAGCSSLKFIGIFGKIVEGERGMITNTGCLPGSLRCIRIFNFLLGCFDASALATRKWDSLDIMELQAIGTEIDVGIPFHSLCELFTLKSIGSLFLRDGINQDSISVARSFSYSSFPPRAARLLLRIVISQNNEIIARFQQIKYMKIVALSDDDDNGGFYIPHGRIFLRTVLFEDEPELRRWQMSVDYHLLPHPII